MSFKIIECPRDAMQGLHEFIPTDKKTSYINSLLKVGFDYIDFGSFVSPKAIPQLRDTAEVLAGLDLSTTKSKLLAIIGNKRGAEEACKHNEISYLGFPYSVSPTFLKLNISSTHEEAFRTIEYVNNLCGKTNKKLVVYLTMAFGNPYGDKSSTEQVLKDVNELKEAGITIVSLADTVGVGTPEIIHDVFSAVLPQFPDLNFGFHLHTTSSTYYEKLNAAYTAGCSHFDSVILGLGGCPMSAQELVGNLSTENLLHFCRTKGIELSINDEFYQEAVIKARQIFPIN